MSDPFTFAVDAIWDVLDNHTAFAALVKEKNRIRLDAGFKPFKETLMEASVPEVAILLAGKRFEENPCSGISIVQTLHVTVTSGLRNTSLVLPTQWRIIQAIYVAINTAATGLMSLPYESENIIKQVMFLPIEEGLTYNELNRTLEGWAAILPLEVKLFLSNSLLGLEET